MAIESTYIAEKYGITPTAAYTKIVKFYVENNNGLDKIILFTNTFYDQNARTNLKEPIGINDFQMTWFDGFTFADLYDFLKTQPEFVGAIDVI